MIGMSRCDAARAGRLAGLARTALRAGAHAGSSRPRAADLRPGHRAPRHGGGAGGARRPHRRRRSCSSGGNAVDAAVATGFALAVTYPRAGNIGGGGFMLIHLANRNIDTAIDYRETAPAATTRDMFLDDKGEADPRKSRDSALAIGVPGTVAGLALAHAKYGSGNFTLAQLIAPAIALAREGIPVEDDLADSLPRAQARLARWPSSAKIFSARRRPPARPGRHAGAARSRRRADRDRRATGRAPSTEGAIADKIVAAVRAGRRHHDARGSEELPADRARAGARQLSRLRHRLDAAAVLGRRAS